VIVPLVKPGARIDAQKSKNYPRKSRLYSKRVKGAKKLKIHKSKR